MIAGEPLKFAEAKERIRNILSGAGSVTPSQHALDQLHARDMTMVDVVNVLRGGYVESAEESPGPGAIACARRGWWSSWHSGPKQNCAS